MRCDLGIETFKTFRGGTNVRLKLRTTVVDAVSAEKLKGLKSEQEVRLPGKQVLKC